LNTVDAVDRPDLTFRINAIFVVLNVILNVLLIWQFGWYGAAVATTISAGVGLGLGYYYAKTIIEVSIPVGEIAKQLVAACIMGFIVYSGRLLFGESLATVIGLVVLGAAVYFSALLFYPLISETLLRTIHQLIFPRFCSDNSTEQSISGTMATLNLTPMAISRNSLF